MGCVARVLACACRSWAYVFAETDALWHAGRLCASVLLAVRVMRLLVDVRWFGAAVAGVCFIDAGSVRARCAACDLIRLEVGVALFFVRVVHVTHGFEAAHCWFGQVTD